MTERPQDASLGIAIERRDFRLLSKGGVFGSLCQPSFLLRKSVGFALLTPILFGHQSDP
jgi:hypothetical protein